MPFCTACRRPSESFAPVGARPEARCPRCQAVERNRFSAVLFDALAPWLATGGRRILEVAPQPITRKVLTSRFGAVHYVAVDLLEDRPVDAWADLTRLPFCDDAFDLVICSHVLEHVPDDRAAMRELARVTAPDGIVVVFIPYRADAPTDEGPLRDGETNESRFGQADHVRWYGSDFDDRLLEEGLRPLVLQPADVLTADEMTTMRLEPTERVWLCSPLTRTPGTRDAPLARLLAGRLGDLRDAGLLWRGPDDRLRDLASIRDRADRSFDWERDAARRRRQVEQLTRERDQQRERADQFEARYRRLAEHPAVRVLRKLRRLLR